MVIPAPHLTPTNIETSLPGFNIIIYADSLLCTVSSTQTRYTDQVFGGHTDLSTQVEWLYVSCLRSENMGGMREWWRKGWTSVSLGNHVLPRPSYRPSEVPPLECDVRWIVTQ